MKKVLFVCVVLVVLTGCIPRQEKQNTTDQDKIAAAMAATLTVTPLVIAPPEEPYQPPDPNASTRTSDPDIPTLTPTITLTPTVTPTPTLDPEDPVSTLGDPWFRDNFVNGSNFFLYDEPQSSYKVNDNQMVLVAKKANNFETWSLASGSMYNFYLEITGTFGDECGGKDRYGLIFRAPDTSEGYLISISCDGSFRLSSWQNEEEKYTSIKPWTTSEYINPGPGGKNRLGIKTNGTTLTGFINGHQIFELDDSTFGTGRFGVLVAATNTPGFTAYLSEIVYWKLK
ncbi:MAG: hypothetical protein E4H33_01835 [Anaerolineales bacterium]|nr:MAG: hypothetical protein E4H33_01835 [Anaerolineales bacterium]